MTVAGSMAAPITHTRNPNTIRAWRQYQDAPDSLPFEAIGMSSGARREIIRVSIFICAADFPGGYSLKLTAVTFVDAFQKSALLVRCGCGLLCLAGSVAEAADWPMFRGGPALIGIAEGNLPAKLASLWTFKTGGAVKSSAAIAQGHVFVGSTDENVYALNVADGKRVWAFKTGGPVESSPLVKEQRVFIGSSDGVLYALDAVTGKIVWKYETGDKILGSPNWVQSGEKISVLVGSYDFKLHCVDAATGKTNWAYETGNYINGSPGVADGKAVFGGCDGLLHVLSLAEGKQIKEIEAGAYIAGAVAMSLVVS